MDLITIYTEGPHRVVVRNETRLSLTVLGMDDMSYVVEPMTVRHITDVTIKEIHFKRVGYADSSNL